PLIRALGLSGASGPNCEEEDARRLMAQAAVNYLEKNRQNEEDNTDFAALYDDLKEHYRRRLSSLTPDSASGGQHSDARLYDRFQQLSLELLRVERETAIQLRNNKRINDEVLRRLQSELDLSETRYRSPTDAA
ncbi:MAG: hypothetical protein ACHP79_01490, partial [Terriglobales bacterium]